MLSLVKRLTYANKAKAAAVTGKVQYRVLAGPIGFWYSLEVLVTASRSIVSCISSSSSKQRAVVFILPALSIELRSRS